jgi:hypothetical protein
MGTSGASVTITGTKAASQMLGMMPDLNLNFSLHEPEHRDMI